MSFNIIRMQTLNDAIINKWVEHYLFQYGMEVEFNPDRIPEKPEGDDFVLICIPKGFTVEREIKSWNFPTEVVKGLKLSGVKHTRKSVETYFKWVRLTEEPDNEFLGHSVADVDPNGEIGLSLLEAVVMESFVFRKTGKHLNKLGVTLCSGSRYGKYVPFIGFYKYNRVRIGYCSPKSKDPMDGIRKVH